MALMLLEFFQETDVFQKKVSKIIKWLVSIKKPLLNFHTEPITDLFYKSFRILHPEHFGE